MRARDDHVLEGHRARAKRGGEHLRHEPRLRGEWSRRRAAAAMPASPSKEAQGAMQRRAELPGLHRRAWMGWRGATPTTRSPLGQRAIAVPVAKAEQRLMGTLGLTRSRRSGGRITPTMLPPSAGGGGSRQPAGPRPGSVVASNATGKANAAARQAATVPRGETSRKAAAGRTPATMSSTSPGADASIIVDEEFDMVGVLAM